MLNLSKLSSYVRQQVRSSLLTCPVEGSRHKILQKYAVRGGHLTVTITFRMVYDQTCRLEFARQDYEMRMESLSNALLYTPCHYETHIRFDNTTDNNCPRAFSSTVRVVIGAPPEPPDAFSSSESSVTL